MGYFETTKQKTKDTERTLRLRKTIAGEVTEEQREALFEVADEYGYQKLVGSKNGNCLKFEMTIADDPLSKERHDRLCHDDGQDGPIYNRLKEPFQEANKLVVNYNAHHHELYIYVC